MRILVTNIGRRTYFVNFLVDLKKVIKNLKIYLTDSNLLIAGLKIKGTLGVKLSKIEEGEKKYIKELIKIVKINKISLIIPVTNYDLNIFSLNLNKFKKMGCHVMISRNDLINKCLDKKKLYELSKRYNFYSPKIFKSLIEVKQSKSKLFIKKLRKGNSSIGQKIIRIPKKDDFHKKYIIQEYINGDELHLDILNDHNCRFISSCLKKKLSMRFGETDIAKLIHDAKIKKLSKKLSKDLKHVGNLDCDIIYDKINKIPYIIDINPRFGGGYPFTHLSGYNFLARYILNFMGKKFKDQNKNNKIFSKGISLI